MKRSDLLVLLATTLVGCRSHEVFRKLDFSFGRMEEQPRYEAYGASPFFGDGAAMRSPPAGTHPYSREPAAPPGYDGVLGGEYVKNFPISIDRDLLTVGQGRFETLCAACHGIRGDGQTVVADYMPRRPPSLHELRIRMLPPGRIFRVIRDGYGLMPSYRNPLSNEETWAVVAYERALERSRHATISRLPPRLAEELARSTP